MAAPNSVEVWLQGPDVDELLYTSSVPVFISIQYLQVVQGGLMVPGRCRCWDTSDVVDLGCQCSASLAFRALAVSPTYVLSQGLSLSTPPQLILYTTPVAFSFLAGSLGAQSSLWRVFWGLKNTPQMCALKVLLSSYESHNHA